MAQLLSQMSKFSSSTGINFTRKYSDDGFEQPTSWSDTNQFVPVPKQQSSSEIRSEIRKLETNIDYLQDQYSEHLQYLNQQKNITIPPSSFPTELQTTIEEVK